MAEPKGNPLDDYTQDFERLQDQKSRRTGGVEARILTNLAFLADEHYVTHAMRKLTIRQLDANKLHLVFNLSGRMMNKLIGRLCSINGTYRARPDKLDPKALADAEVVDKVVIATDEKVGQPSRTWELVYWMAVAGVAFSYETWQKDAILEPMPQFDEATGELLWTNDLTGETLPDSARLALIQQGAQPESFTVLEEMQLTGDISSEVLSPLQVFVDASVRSIADLPPDGAVYIAKIRTVGWIEENFDVDQETLDKIKANRELRIVKTLFEQPEGATTGSTYLSDLIPRIQGSRDDKDPEMAVVVERYQGVSGKNPRGRYSVFVPGEAILLDGENPYNEIPLVDFHWSPPTTNFWTRDFLTSLIPPQKFLNKRISQLGEQANASIYANELLGPGLTADMIPADYPAPIPGGVNEQGLKMIQRRDPPQLPSWFLHSIDLTIKLMKDIAGGADLLDDTNFPGQLRGPLAVPMLQEIIDTEWGPLYEHIGERMSRVKQLRINLIKRFYPAYRTMHYTNQDQKDEVFVFHNQKILGSGVEYRITVERSSLLPELRALREARLSQRLQSGLQVLYTDDRTGRIDKSKVAAELHYGEAARESRETQARKLAGQLIELAVKGDEIPAHIPYPFWDHAAMMDEYEAYLSTTEALRSSPKVQTAVMNLWTKSRDILAKIQEQQEASMQQGMIQNAVAQASQQAAAKAAAAAIESALGPIQSAAKGVAPQAPDMLARAQAENEGKEL